MVLQDAAGEAYRRNASADRESLGAGGTTGGVEAYSYSYSSLQLLTQSTKRATGWIARISEPSQS